ncbi:MAG: hypothetical protein ACR2IH_00925 [Pyrinomonadaceae bacterium]
MSEQDQNPVSAIIDAPAVRRRPHRSFRSAAPPAAQGSLMRSLINVAPKRVSQRSTDQRAAPPKKPPVKTPKSTKNAHFPLSSR